MIKIFLDDIRNPKDCLSYMHVRIGSLNPIYNEEWLIARNFNEFTALCNDNMENISHISFDHDLANEHYDPSMLEEDAVRYEKLYSNFNEKTGYDCALWLKQWCEENNFKLPKILIHTMNPVGLKNIRELFKQ